MSSLIDTNGQPLHLLKSHRVNHANCEPHSAMFYITELTCPPAPIVAQSTMNTSLALYGTVIEYTCAYGNWFPDHNHSTVIKCAESGNWTKYPDNCARKMEYQKLNLYLLLEI